ncbi:MAG: glycoside hydrolase family 43 protein [Bacteroidales bacterium]|nr:glycoside hydrolase family 43 protein [Bacteroidales bacterium]
MPRLITHLSLYISLFLLFANCSNRQKTENNSFPELPVDKYTLDDILVRDPFILPDNSDSTYYLYCATSEPQDRPNGRHGVKMYKSKDLQKWTGPYLVYETPADSWANPGFGIWAPEVHQYNGKYYLFATQTNDKVLLGKDNGKRPPLTKRGTQIFVSDRPEGPFKAFANKSHTPEEWLALDGTLWIEDGTPYMVFCHEWVQITDGTMEYVPLKKDLSTTAGAPKTMFRATDAKWVKSNSNHEEGGYVTDGCFLYRTKTSELLMIWSSFGESGYAVASAISTSGKLEGPWVQNEDLIFSENGGHGMLFNTFDGKLMIALHYPNSGATPHTKLFELTDAGDHLVRKE